MLKNNKDIYNTNISNINNISKNLTNTINHPLTFRLPYPHTAISSFSKSFRDLIHYRIYDDFKDIIFGSYNKVFQQYFQKIRMIENGERLIDIGLPIFNYSIQIDNPDDKLDLPWRSTSYFPGISKVLFPSFYKEDTFELKVIYRRLKGTISSNIYCNSEAESLDIQMAFYDGFRGLNTFNSTEIRAMTILPNEMLFIDHRGRRISKSLASNHITKAFIPSINNNAYYIYNNLDALIQLSSMSPSNNYYGGAGLPEYNLTASFNFEIDIPSYILCLTKENYSGIEINLDIKYDYSDNRVIKSIEYITGKHLDEDINKNPFNNEIISFENGQILNSVVYNITDESNIIPITSILFKDKKVNWNYKNKDIIIFIVYSGGVIRIPIDNNIAKYNNDGDIVIKEDLFNKDTTLQIFVFKFTKDLDYLLNL